MGVIEDIGKKLGKTRLPKVHPGDTVQVHYLIKEGEKERVQIFIGTVLAIQGKGVARAVIVRRIVQGEGVERIFPLHSPRVKKIKVARRGKVRRAKLYYLRDRVGKQTRVEELVGEKVRRERLQEASEAEGAPDRERAPKPKGGSEPEETSAEPQQKVEV